MLFFNYVESFQLPWSFSFSLAPFRVSLRPRGSVQELAGALGSALFLQHWNSLVELTAALGSLGRAQLCAEQGCAQGCVGSVTPGGLAPLPAAAVPQVGRCWQERGPCEGSGVWTAQGTAEGPPMALPHPLPCQDQTIWWLMWLH